ncbi:hypothetical protein OG884_05125 [Streptosporangium sp. NBC_01755]|uniref:hypothetical protein n=1 Tax=Streptosporangium sp. NBC_01755 TaxID=2975949 RepID=UPI002DDA1796|nr:hypothetical protein [Streptosporangium sp. NBC_01755]WSD04307.1 hypothetical protein OG884_05125 [Streptosporangium sp. NBC_01755]
MNEFVESMAQVVTGVTVVTVKDERDDSEATYEPPGLSVRKTTALTPSRRAARSAAQMVSEPIALPPPSGLRPSRIAPLPRTGAPAGARKHNRAPPISP